MKLVSSPLCLALASAALVLAGCKHTPIPIPPDTNPVRTTSMGGPSTDVPTTIEPNSSLTQRPDDFDPNGIARGLLAANTVYFDFDASTIKASERDKLKAAKEYLDKNP